jgi:hypothetical protein
MDKNKLNDVIKYYAIATSKQKLDIGKMLNKSQTKKLTDAESKRLNEYAFKSRMYFYANSANVDSRMSKVVRSSVTCTGVITN